MKKLLFGVLLVISCGGTNGDPDEHATPEEEACEHMTDGPEIAVTAADSATGAPDVSEEHRRYDVTLVIHAGGLGGFVSFEAAEATEYGIFMSTDAPLVVRDAEDVAVALEPSEDSFDACDDVAAVRTYDLQVGTYTLELGGVSTTENVVSLVIEEAEAREHE